MKKAILFYLLFVSTTYAQISGCTDSLAKNFDPTATLNDGSCHYKNEKIKPESSIILSDSIQESSGLLFFNYLFWTFNDDNDTIIYGLDFDGKIRTKINLEKVKNTDWEGISQDSSFIYIGDIGNNYKGNRTDLHILRIDKKSFLLNKPIIDTISFSYSDQTDFKPQKPNNTNFDCEAFIVSKDSIYLFTKQWISKKTTVYVLPKTPGKHIAQFKEKIDVNGLITDLTTVPNKNTIVLCGYSKKLQPFLYLITDLKKFDFSKANKRKIKVKLPFHQIEGITTTDGIYYNLTNESFARKPFINSPQQIHKFNLSDLLKN